MGMGCGISMIKYILFVFNLICAVSTYKKPSFFFINLLRKWCVYSFYQTNTASPTNTGKGVNVNSKSRNCACIVFAFCEVWVRRVGPAVACRQEIVDVISDQRKFSHKVCSTSNQISKNNQKKLRETISQERYQNYGLSGISTPYAFANHLAAAVVVLCILFPFILLL